jgi:hypothetical protein
MLKVVESKNGEWNIIDGKGEILAVETTNSRAWRIVERLENRVVGRKSKLYQSNAATTIKKK